MTPKSNGVSTLLILYIWFADLCKMDTIIKSKLTAYLPASGREEFLKSLASVPEHKLKGLINHLDEVSRMWHPVIESVEYSPGKSLIVRIVHTISSF